VISISFLLGLYFVALKISRNLSNIRAWIPWKMLIQLSNSRFLLLFLAVGFVCSSGFVNLFIQIVFMNTFAVMFISAFPLMRNYNIFLAVIANEDVELMV